MINYLFKTFEISLLCVIIIVLNTCNKETDEPEEELGYTINGEWSGSTSQRNSFTFTVDQDKIISWKIRIYGGGVTQTIDATTSLAIVDYKFTINSGEPQLTISGKFTGNSSSSGTFSFNGGTGTWSASKVTAWQPTGYPNKPELISPVNGIAPYFTNTTLKWSCTDPDNDLLKYDIYFGASQDPPIISKDKTTNSYTPEKLELNTTYYWKIIAKDNQDHSTTGDLWSFTTSGTEPWEKKYGGSGWDEGNDVIPADDGGFVIIGTTASYGSGANDVWLLKINSNGDKLWDRTFGGEEDDKGFSIKKTTDGGYILGGTTNSFNVSEESVWLIKVNNEGIEEWNHIYTNIYDENTGWSINKNAIISEVQQTSDNGYILIGTYNFRSGAYCADDGVLVIKTDDKGDYDWIQIYGYDKCSNGYDIQQTIDGGFIIAGEWGNSTAWIIKINQSGVIQWETNIEDEGIGLDHDEYAVSVFQTDDGNFILSGTWSESNTFYDKDTDHNMWLCKLDATGNLIWSLNYGENGLDGNNNDFGKDLFPTQDGGYVILGNTKSYREDILYDSYEGDLWILKTDAEGNQLAHTVIGDDSDFVGNSIVQTSDGSYLIVGSAGLISSNYTNQDLYILKIGP